MSTNSFRNALSQTQVTELETLSRVGSDRCCFQSLVRNDGYWLTLRILWNRAGLRQPEGFGHRCVGALGALASQIGACAEESRGAESSESGRHLELGENLTCPRGLRRRPDWRVVSRDMTRSALF